VVLNGNVNEFFHSLISIEILSKQMFTNVEVVIDTGFDGDLVLPEYIISQLGLPYLFRNDVELVGKTIKQVDFFRGQIKWLNDEIITVDVIADESFLIGTNLLRHGKLLIDYQSNEVLITK
jgi:clan AA aspartic protease